MYYYEIQYSPMSAKLLGGVDGLRKHAAALAQVWPEDKFYPESWFGEKAQGRTIEITYIQYKDIKIKVVPVMLAEGIRVFHFDPSRELHGIKTGQHRC